MLRMGGSHQAHRHQGVADEPGRHQRADRQRYAPLQQRLIGAAEHGLIQFDADFRSLETELRQTLQQQPGREDDLDRQRQLALPAGRERMGRLFERARLFEQRLGAPVEHLAGGGQL
ncbi:MAG TPA: hypothetical protein VN757_10695 [Steroidobacteraceae bacterium]|nr:hypothetical protein [Steroidobacteraceae bacterium]